MQRFCIHYPPSMKKSLFTSLIFSLAALCLTAQDVKYSVSGEVFNDTEWVYLYEVRFFEMALLLSEIMQMAKTTTSNQRLVTLLLGASLQKHLSMAFIQLTRSNAGWLPPIC